MAILAAVCCMGRQPLLGVAPAAADEPATSLGVAGEADPWLSSRVAAPVMEDRPLQRSARSIARHDAAEAANANDASTAASPIKSGWLRTTLSLAGVVVLIVVLGYASRKLPMAQRGRRPGLIQVLSRTPLSARQSVYLLRVGPRLVMVGATGERLTRLDVVDDPNLTAQLAGDAQRSAPGSHSREFDQRLASEAGRYAADDGDETAEESAPSETRLLDVKQRLAGALERLRARRPA
jgi:flagellar biogenesis protein FliO